MMHGRNNGKKLMAIRIVKHSFEIINLLTNEVRTLRMLEHAFIISTEAWRFSTTHTITYTCILTHPHYFLPLRTHFRCWWMPLPTVVPGKTPLVLEGRAQCGGKQWTYHPWDESTRPFGSSALVGITIFYKTAILGGRNLLTAELLWSLICFKVW